MPTMWLTFEAVTIIVLAKICNNTLISLASIEIEKKKKVLNLKMAGLTRKYSLCIYTIFLILQIREMYKMLFNVLHKHNLPVICGSLLKSKIESYCLDSDIKSRPPDTFKQCHVQYFVSSSFRHLNLFGQRKKNIQEKNKNLSMNNKTFGRHSGYATSIFCQKVTKR